MNKKVITGVTLAVLMLGCGFGGADPSDEDVKKLNDRANAESAPVPTVPNKKIINGGDWKVGAKENLNAGVITVGEYTISSPKDGFGCYYEVVRNFENEGNYIIVNGNAVPGADGKIVKISNKAKGLKLDGDCLAVKNKP